MSENDELSRDVLFEATVTAAGGFYRSVLTVASAFLGGTLVFMEKIAPTPSCPSLIALALGWSALIASIACVVRVQRLNVDSGWRALDGKREDARAIDERTRRLSSAATWLLVAGIFLVAASGIVSMARTVS